MKAKSFFPCLSIALICSFGFSAHALAKNWTIEERQTQLMQDINTAQKEKQLTAKEAKKLRADLAEIARHKAEMKGKSADQKLTAEDNTKLESDLNDISVKIKKVQLNKRVDAKQQLHEEEKKQAKSK
jgi:hypothetical protein